MYGMLPRHPISVTAALVALVFAFTVPRALAQDEFRVWVEAKNQEHPFFQQGEPHGYVLDGVGSSTGIQGRDLVLERGVTYTFQMEDVPADHPFYISTSQTGAGAGVFTDGVTGNFATGNQVLTFTPDENTPNLLFYQCQLHAFMGGRIHVIGEVRVDLEPVASGLAAPVYLTEAPDGSGRLFVVDQAGLIRIIDDGVLLQEPFLDLTDRIVDFRPGFDERGALGLAFHPQYAQNGRFFVFYSAPLRAGAPSGWDHTSLISEFRVSNDPDKADPDSERIVIEIHQPQFNHNGGTVAFGPDGYLYISTGDGGGGNDTGTGHVDDWYTANAGGNGQAFDQNLLGRILRIDIEEEPYAVPSDNPFVGTTGLDEIWAFGLRNPYRISFDSGGTRELYAADAGQGLWEAIYLIEKEGNYGWNVREGSYCFNTDTNTEGRAQCPQEDPDGRPLVPPVIEYPHLRQVDGLGIVVVGGHVYRGTSLPDLDGRYVFGDWSQSFGEPGGRAFVVTERRDDFIWHFSELHFTNRPGGRLGHFLLGFGRDLDGEIYILASDRNAPQGTTGVVYRLAPEGSVSTDGGPAPAALAIEPNHPNPFWASTTFEFHLAEPGIVTLAVYDILGRRVSTLVDEETGSGAHTVTWDGTDRHGRPLASGVYVYQLSSRGETATRKLTILR
jgi:glucose/arabinose dehydrogenase